MLISNSIACVTGASGLIGRRIVRLLTSNGYQVRALSRKAHKSGNQIEYFNGGLEDESVINRMLSNAHSLYHCAGEYRNHEKMRTVNVEGTHKLFKIAQRYRLQYFCHLSSAGVVGKSSRKVVDEHCACYPQNHYEQTKLDAEKIVSTGIDGCRVVILRPTNVVSSRSPGILSTITQQTLKNRLKLFLTGGEQFHLIHVENVAAAAVYLAEGPVGKSEVFFVSADHEEGTRLGQLATAYCALRGGPNSMVGGPFHLPVVIPYVLRYLLKRPSNHGNITYSAAKLIGTGFTFPVSVSETVARLAVSSSGAE